MTAGNGRRKSPAEMQVPISPRGARLAGTRIRRQRRSMWIRATSASAETSVVRILPVAATWTSWRGPRDVGSCDRTLFTIFHVPFCEKVDRHHSLDAIFKEGLQAKTP